MDVCREGALQGWKVPFPQGVMIYVGDGRSEGGG